MTVPLSVVGQLWLLLSPYAVHSPVPHLKRYWCVSAVSGSTTSVSEIAIGVPSFTVVGALKVADGATLLTVTVAEYSTLSPPSSSRTWPLTTTLPPDAAQVWLLPAPYAVHSFAP